MRQNMQWSQHSQPVKMSCRNSGVQEAEGSSTGLGSAVRHCTAQSHHCKEDRDFLCHPCPLLSAVKALAPAGTLESSPPGWLPGYTLLSARVCHVVGPFLDNLVLESGDS